MLDKNIYENKTPTNLGPDRRIILKQFSETYSVTAWTRATCLRTRSNGKISYTIKFHTNHKFLHYHFSGY